MKVDCIFCADLHIMERNPVTRKDDIQEKQWIKLDFISDLQKKYNCPVYCAGDVFDHWKPSPFLLSKAVIHLPSNFRTIYGDHDLPQHNLELSEKSGLNTLKVSGRIKIINGGHGDNKTDTKLKKGTEPSFIVDGKKVFIWHVLTWKKELPFPDCTTNNAKQILKKYPQFDLIVTGDNHKPFIQEYKGRKLLNTGSMMRIRADQINYKPAVWLWNAKKNKLKPVYLPIEENVISREHLEKDEERDERINAFISKMDTDFATSMNFTDNIKKYFATNKTKKKVKQIVYNHIGK